MPPLIPTIAANRTFRALFAAVLLACAIWTVYGRSVSSPFIFDDSASVMDNASLVHLWPLVGDAQNPGPLNPPKELPTAGRPLVNLTLALNYHIGSLRPIGFHQFNLFLHWLTAVLLAAIIRHTLASDRFRGRFDKSASLLAFFTALLWALHPLNSESVIYITQRTELMVGLFYLTTIYCSLCYWKSSPKATRCLWLSLAIAACMAGAASKEVMVTAPVMILLFERTFVTGTFRRALRNSWPLYLGLAASWGLLLALNVDRPRSASAGFDLGVPTYVWWFTQAKVLWMYLKLAVWPWPLVIHYGTPYIKTLGAAWPWLLATGLLAFVTLWLLWRKKPSGYVGAWVFVILSPTLVVPIITEVAAERRMYLPLTALVALVVVGGYTLFQRLARRFSDAAAEFSPAPVLRAAGIVLVLLCAIIFGMIDVRRLADYSEPVALWEGAAANYPNDYLIQNNLGLALYDAMEYRLASEHFQTALKLRPDYAEANYNLGNAFGAVGDAQQAITQFERALKLRPEYLDAHNNLGIALAHLGQTDEALRHFDKALAIRPKYAEAHYNAGVALQNLRRPQEAVDHYLEALSVRPEYLQALANLPLAYAQASHPAEAAASATKAIECATVHRQTALAERLEAWLRGYQATHPELEKPAPNAGPSAR